MCPANVAPRRDALADLAQPLRVRLLLERDDLAVAIEPEDAHRRRIVGGHRLRGDRDVGAPIDVRVDQLAVVHPVQVVAGENQVVVGVVAHEMARGLAHGVGRALKPVRVVGRLLGRQDLDESLAEEIHPVGLRDVPVERRRIELRQHEDPPDVGVQAVADRDVDQPVLAADRHRRLRSMLRERKQPRALAAAENERENFVVHGHRCQQMRTPACNGHVNGSATIPAFAAASRAATVPMSSWRFA